MSSSQIHDLVNTSGLGAALGLGLLNIGPLGLN